MTRPSISQTERQRAVAVLTALLVADEASLIAALSDFNVDALRTRDVSALFAVLGTIMRYADDHTDGGMTEAVRVYAMYAERAP